MEPPLPVSPITGVPSTWGPGDFHRRPRRAPPSRRRNRRAATARPGADSRAAPVGRAAAACFRRRRAPAVALATLLRDQPLSTREISFALGRGRLTGRPSAPAPGCSARPRSARRTPPADRASGANRDTSDRQRMTCSTAMTSAFRFAGAFPVATAYAWPAMGVPALPRREPVELLDHVPRPLLGRGQQPGLVELPGPHLAQNSLGKRFLRDVELRLRCHHHARSVPRRRWSRGPSPFPVRGWAHPASGQVSFFAAFIAAWRFR